jgi:FtsH ternary system-associated peptide
MSRGYRISVAESLSRHVEVEDGVCTTLELLEIVSRERTAQILAAELAKLGFEVDEKGTAVRHDADGIEISVSTATGEVTVRVSGSDDVEVELSRSVSVGESADRAARELKLREGVRAELEQEVLARKESLRRQATERLTDKLRDLKRELDRVSARTTAEALKERAAELGEIQEISEDRETGGVTIRVKV